MTERTKEDEILEEGIELMISGDTDGFVMTVLEGEEVHLLKSTRDIEELLLSVYMVVEEVRRLAREGGETITPPEVMAAAAHVAEERRLPEGEYSMKKEYPE